MGLEAAAIIIQLAASGISPADAAVFRCVEMTDIQDRVACYDRLFEPKFRRYKLFKTCSEYRMKTERLICFDRVFSSGKVSDEQISREVLTGRLANCSKLGSLDKRINCYDRVSAGEDEEGPTPTAHTVDTSGSEGLPRWVSASLRKTNGYWRFDTFGAGGSNGVVSKTIHTKKTRSSERVAISSPRIVTYCNEVERSLAVVFDGQLKPQDEIEISYEFDRGESGMIGSVRNLNSTTFGVELNKSDTEWFLTMLNSANSIEILAGLSGSPGSAAKYRISIGEFGTVLDFARPYCG